MKTQARINKHPYILWLTSKQDVELDIDNMTVSIDDTGNTSIKQISLIQVFIMKFLPILFLLYVGGAIPHTKQEFILLAIAIVLSIISLIVCFKTKLFRLYIIAVIVTLYYLLFSYPTIAVFYDMIFLYVAEMTLVSLIIREFIIDLNSTYYVLEDIKLSSNVRISERKKRPLIKIFRWSFLSVNTGFKIRCLRA